MSVVAALTSRAPVAAAVVALNVASTRVGSTNATDVVVTPVPDTMILTPLEKFVPVTRTVWVVPCFCVLGLSDLTTGCVPCAMENRQVQVFWLPSVWVSVGWYSRSPGAALRRSKSALTEVPLYDGLVPVSDRSVLVDDPASPTNARPSVPDVRLVPVKVRRTGAPLGSLLPASGETPVSGPPLTVKHCEQVAVLPSGFVTTTSRGPVGVLAPTVHRRVTLVGVVIPLVMAVPPESVGAAFVVIAVSVPVRSGSSTATLTPRLKPVPLMVMLSEPPWAIAVGAALVAVMPPGGANTEKQAVQLSLYWVPVTLGEAIRTS